MGVPAVRISTSHKNRPDKERRHDLIRPLDGVIQEVAKNNIHVDQNDTEGQRRTADDCVKVCKYEFWCNFLFHRQSLTKSTEMASQPFI